MMIENKVQWILKRIHLIISLIIVIPTAIIYGVSNFIESQLDIQVCTVDLSNLLKAIMMLYFGVSLIWMLGILQSKYWEMATRLNILFMMTLASGRLLSMVIDGIPTDGYIFGVIAELSIGLLSIYQLKIYGNREKF